MAEPRAEQTATLLQDGEVLVVGGYNEGGSTAATSLTLAQLFDPSTRSWVQAAPALIARNDARAALLANGSVLVVGGTCAFLQYDLATEEWVCESTTTAEAYDPSSNTWNPVAAPPELQWTETLTALADGRVLLVGEFGPHATNTTFGAAVYDPDTDTWSSASKPLVTRSEATATLMSDGDVLFAGGFHGKQLPGLPVQDEYTVFDSAETYDPSTNEWAMVAPMLQPRASQAATLLMDGSVFVAGGDGSVDLPGVLTATDVLASAETYDPTTNTWQPAAPMNLARTFQTATALPDGDVLMVGGQECNSEECLGYGQPPAAGDCCAASSAEVYEPSPGRWSFTAPITSGTLHTATLLQNGEVLVAGGHLLPLGSGELDSAYVYGPTEAAPPSSPQASQVVRAVALKLTDVRQSRRIWRERHVRRYARGGHAAARSTHAAARSGHAAARGGHAAARGGHAAARGGHAAVRSGHAAARSTHASVRSSHADARNRQAIPVGTDFHFVVNESANVRFTFTQLLPGKLFGKKCRSLRPRVDGHPSCVRKKSRGTLEVSAHPGANRVAFRGRLSHDRLLPVGRYSVRAVAETTTARSSVTVRSFTIVR
ncbi:MAG TPA: kelch repeat-containing protein [Solirubrobacteraceae bacterium]